MRGPLGGASVALGEIVDRLDTDDGSAVLVSTGAGHHVVRLSPVGVAVLDVLAESGEPVALGDLAEALVDRLGAPDGVEPVSAARAVVDQLAEQHVVVAES